MGMCATFQALSTAINHPFDKARPQPEASHHKEGR